MELDYRRPPAILTLWRLYRGQRRRLFLAAIFFILKHSPAWAIPLCTGEIINAVAEPSPTSRTRIAWFVVILAVLILQNVPNHVIFTYFLSKAVRSVQLVLRSALVTRLQQLSISFHDDFHAGRMQSKVLRDVDAVENLSRVLVNTGLTAILGLVVAVGVVVYKRQWNVLGFFVLAAPSAAILMKFFRARMAERNQEFRREIEAMSASVGEMIEMIPVTRAHAAEDREVSRLREKLERIRSLGRRLDLTNESFASSAWTTFQMFSFGCLLFTVYLLSTSRLQVGDVVMYQGYFGQLIFAVNSVLMMMPQISAGTESLRSIGEVLESPDVEKNTGKLAVKTVAGAVGFEDVCFRYPSADKNAIDAFSLDIRAGECIAVVGESGSGKSTLMNLLIGFRRPTSGRILLDGRDMATLNLRDFRRFLAVVPQHTVLFSGTVRENITYGLEGVKDAEVERAIDAANVREFVEKMPHGLATRLGAHGSKLSGGQRQRIAIARAILRDPRVIILDEATSSLDVISEHLVQQALNRLIKGRTTFIVAHRLSTIRNADRIVVMKDGRIVEAGTHDQLLAAGAAFSRLKALQT